MKTLKETITIINYNLQQGVITPCQAKDLLQVAKDKHRASKEDMLKLVKG